MKKLISILLGMLAWIYACENQDQEWEDFDLQAVYFPFQTPLRTLSLGEDRIDNSLDKELKFDIGISIGGMYKNTKDWSVDYVLSNALTDSVYNSSTGDKLLALPSSYYTLTPQGTATIPKGSFDGLVRVELTQAFLDDTLSLTGRYVIPLVLTSTTADSILEGNPAVPDADRRKEDNWEANSAPKDWVLFGIKYVNAYQGTWLQRGRDIVSTGGVPTDTVVYRSLHPEKNRVVSIKSTGKTKSATTFISQNSSLTGQYAMGLEFANMWGTPGGAITITPRAGSLYAVTGSGQYFDKSTSVESWIGLKWPSMHLSYTYDDGVNTHQVTDTLVFRDRGLKFETNPITVNAAIP